MSLVGVVRRSFLMITTGRASCLNSAMGREPWEKSLETWSHMQKEQVEADVVTHEVEDASEPMILSVRSVHFVDCFFEFHGVSLIS